MVSSIFHLLLLLICLILLCSAGRLLHLIDQIGGKILGCVFLEAGVRVFSFGSMWGACFTGVSRPNVVVMDVFIYPALTDEFKSDFKPQRFKEAQEGSQ